MTAFILVVVFAIAGLLAWALASNQKLAMAGLVTYGCAFLSLMLQLAGRMKIFALVAAPLILLGSGCL